MTATDELTAAEIIRDETRLATAPTEVPTDGSGVYFKVDQDGAVELVDANELLDPYRDAPRRDMHTRQLLDPDAFAGYLAKHGLARSEVYADVRPEALKVTAVIDASSPAASDAPGTPGWAKHEAIYRVVKTAAWRAWEAIDGKLLDQLAMAEHFEDRLPDFTEPTGADMLEVAQSLQVSRTGRFESSQRVKSGETNLVYRDQHDATTQDATKRTIAVPDAFELALQPFEGSPMYRVPCRFRYRLNDGRLKLIVKMDRPEDIIRSAFDDVVKVIAEKTGRTIWLGVA